MRIKTLIEKSGKIKNNLSWKYIRYLQSLPIDKHAILLEGGQGQNLNGNMFVLLRELAQENKWKDYSLYWVVTEENFDSAKKRLSFYNIEQVKIVLRLSDEYLRILATAGFLFTDNSFPPFFSKRDGQIFMNTWHGTPLKTLGNAERVDRNSIANVQKTYLMCDYALFPNDFTRDVFYNDYNLKHIYKGNLLMCDYPRNAVFLNKPFEEGLREELGLKNKRLLAYMPTWRGSDKRTKDAHTTFIKSFLSQMDKKLDNDTILFVNLHFLINDAIDYSDYKNIKQFPSEHETYDFLSICDVLITDYSSVFFDFAQNGKKVILFAYDKEEYLASRGMYLSLDSLPFPICHTVEELFDSLKDEKVEDRKDFVEKFCKYANKDTIPLLLERVIYNKINSINVKKNENISEKTVLVYCGALNSNLFHAFEKYFSLASEDKTYILAFKGKVNEQAREFFDSLPPNVITLRLLSSFQFSVKEFLYIGLSKIISFPINKRFNDFYERERKRLFFSITPDKIVVLDGSSAYMAGVLTKFNCPLELHLHYHPEYLRKRAILRRDKAASIMSEYGATIVDNTQEEKTQYFEKNTMNIAHPSHGRRSVSYNFMPFLFNTKKALNLLSIWSLKSTKPCAYDDIYIEIEEGYKIKPKFILPHSKKRLSKRKFNIIYFSVPGKDVNTMGTNNSVYIAYFCEEGLLVKTRIIYNKLYGKRFVGAKGGLFTIKDIDTVVFFRQDLNNRLKIYTRKQNTTDPIKERVKIALAFFISYIYPKNDIILLFEKNSSKYEESASVLYERLIDEGYRNAYFIISRTSESLGDITQDYKDNIIYKNTFKHYLYFFKSKTFLGTEALVHAIDLKTISTFALYKIGKGKYSYVFLQHGVMYMVSLNSESRKLFRRKRLKGKYKVVVSSQLEANHFIELGKHYPEDLYICGLPKYDKNYLDVNADKITIMLTWRPWELNKTHNDFGESKYFKFIMRIYSAIPSELKDKVDILPHPLIGMEMERFNSVLGNSVKPNVKYDKQLRQTKLLITDYSSIAYDAFYRGSNVIFCWEEKDESLEAYGKSSILMLNDENVFGDICYSVDDIKKVIKENYHGEQKPIYKENYSKIVEFQDGNNTKRLIEFMKDDGLI
ncbi:MAG TPA: CDP-glycerol glycerophosphotransferase family protein [Oscillospiraceae bacterium]|nr:CDP-glycerol glycerophosphotransferase family protein [Oscillospiraceae bacterium]